jgi:DNA-binding GntR family transcriptional regulator
LPHRLVPGLAQVDFTTASLFEQLRDRYHVRITRAETVIGARLADAEEARQLRLSDPPVGLSVDQRTFGDGDQVVEISRSLHHPLRLPVRVSQSVDRTTLRPDLPDQHHGDDHG